jgi:hypothetical protein
MSDYFRIVRGLEIDESVRILRGSGVPGLTADTNAAQVGSLYLNTADGITMSKIVAGSGTDKWSTVSNQLYAEQLNSPVAYPFAGANNSVAIGAGAQIQTGADYSLALGLQSLSRHHGGMVFASGRFGSTGDAQAGSYLLRTTTVNATFTEALLDGAGGTQRLVLPDDSTWSFRVRITGHRTDVSDGHAGYTVEGVIYRAAGAATTAFQGIPIKNVLAESDSQWDINITADTTNGSLKVDVKGQPGKTIRWVAFVETLEVTT